MQSCHCQQKCDVIFNGNIILPGYKDPTTDLWTLQILTKVCIPPGLTVLPQPGPCLGCAPHTPIDASNTHPGVTLATFTHSVITWANAVKYAHQSLCNPKFLTLLKAVCKGFHKGCPNISKTLILKYLNSCSAMAKGYMKQPRHSIHIIRSTRHHPAPMTQPASPVLPLFEAIPVYPWPAYGLRPGPNVIMDDDDKSIANIFCFGAFANRNSGILYHDLTGWFLVMSLDGSVCFFLFYHYESNAILVTPIAGLDNRSIFTAYKTYFEELTATRFNSLSAMNGRGRPVLY
jgi:hypothetical protein